MTRLLVALAGAALVFFAVAPAVAQGSVAELAQRLRNGTDFRVRTQAALALGASSDRSAVQPLCGGLSDVNTTVRAAAAAALGRLALGGSDCLSRRLAVEESPDVRSVIQRALERLEPAPGIDNQTKYYVAIGEVTNDTERETSALDRIVRAALAKHIGRVPGFVVAPKGESEAQAKALLAKHKAVKGIYVWPKVKIRYSGGTLSIKLELSLFSYPNKDLKGSMSRPLSMSGASPGDTESENEMIQVAAEALVPDLARNAARI